MQPGENYFTSVGLSFFIWESRKRDKMEKVRRLVSSPGSAIDHISARGHVPVRLWWDCHRQSHTNTGDCSCLIKWENKCYSPSILKSNVQMIRDFNFILQSPTQMEFIHSLPYSWIFWMPTMCPALCEAVWCSNNWYKHNPCPHGAVGSWRRNTIK